MKKRKSVLKPEMSNFEMVVVFSDKYYELSDMLVNRLMKVVMSATGSCGKWKVCIEQAEYSLGR